ncbi:LysR family transcriptional regulator [Phytopseudomonas punonensis]|uniref:Transcriptional regulator, LysR family n=1 Tax=Phytopseudomonas punonensis TaxID=1220495 RepID=A0A1M6YU48_9GAMM|nr:LysR family transcriptional regulator [Pseudomonas punonensis]SHL21737.1 transcriptional regulator, LysR family [Pseudomonas punonensis]
MDMDLKTLGIFVEVAERKSFVRAAEALGITQAGVSNAIKRLEAQVDTALLVRTTRSVNLTVDGEAFFHRCRQVLADLNDARLVLCRAGRQPTGTLRLSLPVSFGRYRVVPLLGEFQARHPQVDLAVSISDRYVNLVEEGMDVAIRFGPLDDSSLIARPLVQVRRRVVGTPAYFTRHGVPESPDDLARHNCLALTYHETGRSRAWAFQEAGEPRAFKPRGSLNFNDGQALHTAALAGFGLGQIHDYYVRSQINAGQLVPVLDAWEPTADLISIVYPQSRHLSPRVRAFVDFMVEALASEDDPSAA